MESDAGKVVTAEYWSPISLAEKNEREQGVRNQEMYNLGFASLSHVLA